MWKRRSKFAFEQLESRLLLAADLDSPFADTPAAAVGRPHLPDHVRDHVQWAPGLGWRMSDDLLLAPSEDEWAQHDAGVVAAAAEAGTGGPSAAGGSPSGFAPYGATADDPSEFMLGDVYVTVVLLESDGSIDPNTEDWTSTQITEVKNEILEGLNWWEQTLATQFPDSPHELAFHVDFTHTDAPVPTGYEPIGRPSSDQSLWIDDFLDHVGANTNSSLIVDLDGFAHNQRLSHGADWGTTIFVVHSAADANGRFADHQFAYAYLGGPMTVMTYDNSGWGINRMGQVLAHEMGHIFYALDEYAGGHDYTLTSGYYGVQNLNGFDGHPDPTSRVDSIMAGGSLQTGAYANHTSSPTSLEMIGWRDTDGDHVFDVLDVPLTLTATTDYDAETNQYVLTGSSHVNTLPNENRFGWRHEITLNTVDTLQSRLDGGDWIGGSTYGQYSTSVTEVIDTSAMSAGGHTIEFRTVDDETGVASNTVSDSFVINASIPAGITVTPTSGLVTTEAGGTASFDVVLDSAPNANVTIDLTSNNPAEGLVSTTELVFTPANWNGVQSVTVTGIDDWVDDGDVSYSIVLAAASSTDARYDGLDATDVVVTNSDDDQAGVSVTPTAGLSTGEAGGTAEFQVVLDSQPLANVVINLSSDDDTEGTVSPTHIEFTPSDWNTPRTVTVTGVDDDELDGDVAYDVSTSSASSSDLAYDGLDPADVSLINTDDESPGPPGGGMYVWDIYSETRTRGKRVPVHNAKIRVQLRHDSDGDGRAESSDEPVAKARVTIVISGGAGGTFTGRTNGEGLFSTSWIELPVGSYQVEVTQLSHAQLDWNGGLDPTANDSDTDGNGLPDESLSIGVGAAPTAVTASDSNGAVIASAPTTIRSQVDGAEEPFWQPRDSWSPTTVDSVLIAENSGDLLSIGPLLEEDLLVELHQEKTLEQLSASGL